MDSIDPAEPGVTDYAEELALAAQREAAMRRSHFWRLRDRYVKLKRRLGLMGPDPLAPDAQANVLDPAHRRVTYERWLARNDVKRSDLQRMREMQKLFPLRPRISIVVPVCDPQVTHFQAMLDSVEAQVYPDWELCLADDASVNADVRSLLDRLDGVPRIAVHRRSERGGISAASNDALRLATGEFVVLLDHDDILAPHALFEIAFAVNRLPDTDVFYSDEDKVDEAGRFDPFFKPDWSPETLLSRMFAGHLLCYRRERLDAAGGFRSEFDGSQDYDALLRITEQTDRIVHIPAVLYHWRVHSRSTASSIKAKPYTVDAAVRAVRAALERRGIPALVEPASNGTSFVHVVPTVRGTPGVAVIIPTRDKPDLLNRALEAVFAKAGYDALDVIVVDNGSVEKETGTLLATWRATEPDRLRVVRNDEPFNYSAINNAAAQMSDAPFLLLLNNDVEALDDGWLRTLLGWVQLDGVGIAGPLLLYPDMRVQHAGVVIGINGLAEHAYRYSPSHHLGYFGGLQSVTNYSAVTGACLLTRRSVYDAIGGLDESLPVAWNDIDFCLKVRKAGYRIVYVPDARLIHHESATRGVPKTGAQLAHHNAEIERMRERWSIATTTDPYYHEALTLDAPNFGLRL